MIEASCHCGAVRMEIDSPPETVTSCNCSICRKLGTLWAYYQLAQVKLIPESGATQGYSWGEKSIELNRCRVCGATTHWMPIDRSEQRFGINARLLEPKVLAAARVRYLDGADTWKYQDGEP